jgi:hypothetical protein
MERRPGAVPPADALYCVDFVGCLQADVVVEFAAEHEKGRWCVITNSSGSVLEQGLFIEASLILPMPLPLHLLRPAIKAAIGSNPLL